MNENKLLRDVASLPIAAQKQAIDFISYLKFRYAQHTFKEKNVGLESIDQEPFVGMWKNRSDLEDSNVWLRDLRKKEWN